MWARLPSSRSSPRGSPPRTETTKLPLVRVWKGLLQQFCVAVNLSGTDPGFVFVFESWGRGRVYFLRWPAKNNNNVLTSCRNELKVFASCKYELTTPPPPPPPPPKKIIIKNCWWVGGGGGLKPLEGITDNSPTYFRDVRVLSDFFFASSQNPIFRLLMHQLKCKSFYAFQIILDFFSDALTPPALCGGGGGTFPSPSLGSAIACARSCLDTGQVYTFAIEDICYLAFC